MSTKIMSELSNDFDKRSAEFCDQVKKLAQEKGLQVFVVAYNHHTDNGSSYTSPIDRENLDNPITNARLAHEKWELTHGINPNHKR